MAGKGEYEVARLHTDPAFEAQLDAMFKHGTCIAPASHQRADAFHTPPAQPQPQPGVPSVAV